MSKTFFIENTVAKLPEDWDSLAACYFQKKEFLHHCEKYNPCNQRYYMMYDNKALIACAVVYSIRLDLLTFLRIKSPLKMHIAGIPCSVSCPGIFGAEEAGEEIKKYIFEKEKGFVLALNLLQSSKTKNIASGNTLPTIILKNNFASWEDYTGALRADYRRRLKHILSNEAIKINRNNCSHFTEEMYTQYLSVHGKSKDKLEKLTFDFFKNLPECFCLWTCLNEDKLIGWDITVYENSVYYFFLGGIDYHYNKENSTYFRLLLNIIEDAISLKAEYVDLGQTAEIPKMRIGGLPEKRYMEARHSNKLFNVLINKFEGSLEYRRKLETVHVFKQEVL